MKRINLIYWNNDNYGDAINPLLVEELSGGTTQHKNIELSRRRRFNILLNSVLSFSLSKCREILFPWNKTLLCIGSIMSWGNTKSTIWGSGFMNEFDTFKGGKILAVRGKETNRKLQEMGFEGCEIYGDPALLLPLWIKPVREKKHVLGLIPHWKEVDYFVERYGDRYHIIDLRTKSILSTTQAIASCEYILSTSLHGLIVAHAYGVPALWIKKGYIDTDGFKFKDYFSSVGIPYYNGFEDIDEVLTEEQSWRNIFQEHAINSVIANSLQKIQFDLLKAAPFPLKSKYKDYIK